MSVFVNISAVIISALYTAAVICFVLFVVSFFVRRRRRAGALGERAEVGDAPRGRFAKWSSKSWGNYAVGFTWWYFLAAFIFVFVAGAYAGITGIQESETLHPPVTEDNSPVNMFLQLDENITLEQVMAQEDERDWYFSTTSESNEFQKRVGTTVKGIDIRPAWSEESGQQNDRSYLYYEQSDGELLELYFAVEEDNSSWLVYARLVIKTDDGVASCYYYPTDITKWGGETGFNLSVKGAGQLFQRKYLLETAQEVMDIVYPLVYPNGY